MGDTKSGIFSTFGNNACFFYLANLKIMNFNLVYTLKWAKNSSLSLKVRQSRIISRIFIKRSTISIIEPFYHKKEVSSRKNVK